MTTAKTVALALTVASVLAAALSYGTLLIGAYVASPGGRYSIYAKWRWLTYAQWSAMATFFLVGAWAVISTLRLVRACARASLASVNAGYWRFRMGSIAVVGYLFALMLFDIHFGWNLTGLAVGNMRYVANVMHPDARVRLGQQIALALFIGLVMLGVLWVQAALWAVTREAREAVVKPREWTIAGWLFAVVGLCATMLASALGMLMLVIVSLEQVFHRPALIRPWPEWFAAWAEPLSASARSFMIFGLIGLNFLLAYLVRRVAEARMKS